MSKQLYALGAVVMLYFISHGVYNIYFHALANFPGSKLWTCTRFTYLLSLWSGRLARDVRDLHGRYGDVVRIAPNELSFARPDAWHDVYSNRAGQPAFPKSKLWHGVAPGRPMSVLNALEPRSHARFRKAMDPAFTERAVRAQEPIIQNYVGSLILNLRKTVAEGSGVVDIVRWYAFVAFDLVGDLGFGESFDCLQHTEFHPWVSMIFNSLRAATYRASLRYYPSLDWLLKFAIPRSVMQKQMEHWKLAVDKINRRLDLPLESGRPDLISLIKRDDAGVDGLTLPEMQATASVIIVAGSETTVSVLSGTTNYLVKNPSKLGILTREIRDKFRKEEDITLTALKDKAPYLNAVIQEGFRLCNPTPVGLPRVVPQGGATVSGYFIPEDNFVNVHPLAMSSSSKFFHEPDEFHPERWLHSSKDKEDDSSPFTNDNRDAVQVFSVGPRSCIGKPLALAELRLIIARLVWRFDMQKADTEAGRLGWNDQRVFTVVERKPFEVRLMERPDSNVLV